MRADVADLPPVLDPTFDSRKESFARTFMRLGKRFARNSFRVRKAYKTATAEYNRFRELISGGMEALEAMGLEEPREAQPSPNAPILIGVVGRPYNLYERYTNMDLFRKLENMGAQLVTPDMLPQSVIQEALMMVERPPYWELAREIVGSALHFLSGHAEGVIHLVSFECGPDSLIQYLLEFENRNLRSIPYVPLVLDEHTGEAGLVTRLEAFVDMVVRKPDNVNYPRLKAGACRSSG
jgi:predicted nucleotide-binding protein (sugar kinase/HSP70/actin superfamily)